MKSNSQINSQRIKLININFLFEVIFDLWLFSTITLYHLMTKLLLKELLMLVNILLCISLFHYMHKGNICMCGLSRKRQVVIINRTPRKFDPNGLERIRRTALESMQYTGGEEGVPPLTSIPKTPPSTPMIEGKIMLKIALHNLRIYPNIFPEISSCVWPAPRILLWFPKRKNLHNHFG